MLDVLFPGSELNTCHQPMAEGFYNSTGPIINLIALLANFSKVAGKKGCGTLPVSAGTGP